MLNFCSLYSGSSGNSLFVESENTKILIDTGVSSKKIEEALHDINVEPSLIDAVLVTHEHTDHIQGLGTFSKKFNIPIFANTETIDNMPSQIDKIDSKNIKKFKVSEHFEIGDLSINSFSIPHDAANPCGFIINKDNKKISIATDIGHMTNDILKILNGSNFILLEANYDSEVLKCSKYPFSLKNRIAGPNGHLSNVVAGKTLSCLIKSGLESAVLGHLSKESNFPELAYQTVINELLTENYDEKTFSLSVASRTEHSKLFEI